MEGGEYMNDSAWIWPASDMDFWKIDNKETSVKIKWSHNCFEDYKTLSYQFYKCGYKTFEEVIGSGYDNVKSDMWFLTGIFLVRHSIELGLKALLCRVLPRKRDIEDAFEACCHDVSMLFHKYTDVRLENYLTEEEEDWLIRYLDSLEEVDKKSDMFRFPFEDEFLSKYRDKFLDNVDVANNMLQGYALVKKCIERGIDTEEDEFDGKLDDTLNGISDMLQLYDEYTPDILTVKDVNMSVKKIAGVRTPVLDQVEYEIKDFSLFNAPGWFLDGIQHVKEVVNIALEREFYMRKMELLDRARKKTTQKVNLYEKVQIPGFQEAIRKIKRFLEDEENLSKSAQKIVKTRKAMEDEA